ncbi:MAG: HD domain-containing protein [Candidatus Taylorbacteria bacterium]|nr:HD domain-containing protein [Candidatus Taylorbacteria bacterium]
MNTEKKKRLLSKVAYARGSLSHLRTNASPRRDPIDGDILQVLDPFAEDEGRILCSKAFRRLAQKTQVTSFPTNTYIRNRLVHTAEVKRTAEMITDILGLNTRLAGAIAWNHDIGHVPFGHQGEFFMKDRFGKTFTHEVMGVVVAQHIERKGKGTNLTFATLDGGMRHSGDMATKSMTAEAWAVRYADKIAFLFADYNDFERMGWPFRPELKRLVDSFGADQRERVFTAVAELVAESKEKGRVSFSESPAARDFDRIRTLMYEIYPRLTQQDPRRILVPVCDFLDRLAIAPTDLMFALMTDRDMVYLSEVPMLNIDHLKQTSVYELLPIITKKKVDIYAPDLDWGNVATRA